MNGETNRGYGDGKNVKRTTQNGDQKRKEGYPKHNGAGWGEGNHANGNNVKDIFSGETVIERKTFIFDLKENPRGRFLRITEEVGGRRDIIIIPATGLHRFRDLLERSIQANEDAGPPATF